MVLRDVCAGGDRDRPHRNVGSCYRSDGRVFVRDNNKIADIFGNWWDGKGGKKKTAVKLI